MLEDLNPTTRCYPRTLLEAFPNSIDRAGWFYPPEQNNSWCNLLMAYVALVMWVGLAYYCSNN